jgi:hypothetical protein
VETITIVLVWEGQHTLAVQHRQDTRKVVTFHTITKDMQLPAPAVLADISTIIEDQMADLVIV